MVVADQSHAFDGVLGGVELSKDLCDLSGDTTVHDQLSVMVSTIKASVGHGEVSQVGEWYWAASVPGAPFEYACFDGRSDRRDVGAVSSQQEIGDCCEYK